MSNGDVTPRPQGGDRKSCRIEAEAKFILQQIEKRRDITLVELHAGKIAGTGNPRGYWRAFAPAALAHRRSRAAKWRRTS
jgi:hypothetical protein